jgi:hypothetical protein
MHFKYLYKNNINNLLFPVVMVTCHSDQEILHRSAEAHWLFPIIHEMAAGRAVVRMVVLATTTAEHKPPGKEKKMGV